MMFATSRKCLIRAACAAVAVGMAAAPAPASLTIDVRVKGTGEKAVSVQGVGDFVEFDIFARVVGTNPALPEGFQIVQGNLKSTNGTVTVPQGAALGNMKALVLSPFDSTAAQNGTIVDLDADGDLDVGSNIMADAEGFFAVRSGTVASPSPQAITQAGTVDPANSNATEFRIGTFRFDVTGLLSAAGQTQILFANRTGNSSAAVWVEDSPDPSFNPNNGSLPARDGFDPGFLQGIPVILTQGDLPQWKINGSATWGAAGNWTNNAVPDNQATARFLGKLVSGAPATITLDSSRTVGNLVFNNSVGGAGNSYRIINSAGATLTLFNDLGSASIVVNSGNHEIAAPVVINTDPTFNVATGASIALSGTITAADRAITKQGGGTLKMSRLKAASLNVGAGTVQILANGASTNVSRLTALSIAAGASVDLVDNDLVVNAGTSLDAARDLIKNGQLKSSVASAVTPKTGLGYATASQLSLLNFEGEQVSGDVLLVKFTFLGDSDLNGLVDVTDFTNFYKNLGKIASGATWFQGDFDYNGLVDVADFTLLFPNLGKSGLSAEQLSSMQAKVMSAVGAVPEPGTLGLLGIGALGLLGRRRKNSSISTNLFLTSVG